MSNLPSSWLMFEALNTAAYGYVTALMREWALSLTTATRQNTTAFVHKNANGHYSPRADRVSIHTAQDCVSQLGGLADRHLP